MSVRAGFNVPANAVWQWNRTEPDYTAEDLKMLGSWGFDSVCITVDWGKIEGEGPGIYNESYFLALDRLAGFIRGAGMKVVLKVAITPWAARSYWMSHEALWTDPEVQERFYLLWEYLIGRYGPDIAFILNEPVPHTPPGPWTDEDLYVLDQAWNLGGVSDEVIRRIRALSPSQEVYMSFGPWASVNNLRRGYGPRPFGDVTYAFSVYDPFEVTHLGEEYFMSGGNFIERFLGPMLEFRNLAPVHVSEFGINLVDYPVTDSRLEWMREAVTTFNRLGLSWWVWNYTNTVGFWSIKFNERVLDLIRRNIPMRPEPFPWRNLIVFGTIVLALSELDEVRK